MPSRFVAAGWACLDSRLPLCAGESRSTSPVLLYQAGTPSGQGDVKSAVILRSTGRAYL